MIETVLIGVKGDDNFYDIDLSTDLDPADDVVFLAASEEADLTEVDAIIIKKRSDVPPGVVDISTTEGQCQVQCEPADTENLEDTALVWKVVLTKADVGMNTTVLRGTWQFG